VRTTTVIIGAGHSGLAMSHRLTERSIDHVVLERGEVAHSWRTERWESLRLLTPTWHAALPGAAPPPGDPDGYMTMPQVIEGISGYATVIDAPVRTHTTVRRVSATDGGYDVETDQGTWSALSVVLASGACNQPSIPAAAEGVPSSIEQLTPLSYRSPAQLVPGGVLIVGAAASGAQLADEIARTGRRVTLSTGEHVRMPRTYRGRDVFRWLEAVGILDETWDQMDDIIRARHVPSPQLIGTPERRDIDMNTLRDLGVEVVGKLGAIRDGVALFSGGLGNTYQLADMKLKRLLDRFDAWAEDGGMADELAAPDRPEPTRPDATGRIELDLEREGIGTVLWATGYRPDLSWLDVPVFGYKGAIRHDGGVVAGCPGLYLLGSSLLRRRRSSYIGGAAQDTADLADHLSAHLAGRVPPQPEPLPA
jgi:putative flavoprotein involved in K+ transport